MPISEIVKNIAAELEKKLKRRGIRSSDMLTLVLYRNLLIHVPEGVYEPSHDTLYLLSKLILKRGETMLDLGSGSGIVALARANRARWVTGVDIDNASVSCARSNARLYGITNATFLKSSWFDRLKGQKFDLIVANLPQYPKPPGDIDCDYIDRAVNAGEDGRKHLDEIIAAAPAHLNPYGRIQINQSQFADIGKTVTLLRKKGLRPVITARRYEPTGRTSRERLWYFKKLGHRIRYKNGMPQNLWCIITAWKD